MNSIRLQSIGFILVNMFLTHEAHKSAIHSLFCDADEAHWHAVEVLFRKPWFLATIQEIDSADQGRRISGIDRTVLLTSIDHLLGLSEHTGGSGIQLRAAYVATPGYMNPTRDWCLDRIATVWRTAHVSAPSSELIETTDGNLIPLLPSSKWDGRRESLQLVKRFTSRPRKLRGPPRHPR